MADIRPLAPRRVEGTDILEYAYKIRYSQQGETLMPNGKPGDNPLSDLTIHGMHPFPPDIEDLLRRIDTLGRRAGQWPLGENWPFSPREFEWEKGKDLEAARRDLAHLIAMLERGRGDKVLVDPVTGKPLMAD